MSIKLVHGVNPKISNAEYHADRERLSSSDFKLLLKDPQAFYKKKVLGQYEPLEGSWLDEGSYTHALILEPEIVATDFAVFDGMRKQGKDWEAFASQVPKNKIILSKAQVLRCKGYFEAYKRNKLARELVEQGGVSEETVCADVHGIPSKVRTDWLNVEKGYIADVKTSGFSIDRDSFKLTIKDYSYELSAALYLRVIEEIYGKPFDFYFIAIGKKELECKVYKLSAETRKKGDFMLLEAAQKYKKCMKSGIWLDSQPKIVQNEEIEEV